MASIYDHPPYYDILFGWDRDAEAASYDAIFREQVPDRDGPLLELGCGTGQICIRLARIGWDVTGLDASPAMLGYLEAVAMRAGVRVRQRLADMRDFRVDTPFAGAFCPLGTLGMLPDDGAVIAHLRAVAAALAPGAPYVLDLTLEESSSGHDVTDEWEMERDGVVVDARTDGISVRDPEAPEPLELTWGPPLRHFSPNALRAFVRQAGVFALEGSHAEAGRDGPDGVSVFARERTPGVDQGRALVVLSRPQRA